MKNIITKTIIKIAILLLLVACSTAKYVPKGKFLLQNVKIKVDDNRVSKSEVSAYLKQKRNSRTFGLVPLYLWIYNMSGADSTKKVNQFLRNLGEAPVVYDSIQTQRTLVQLKRFMENKGFFNATVDKKEIFGSRKVKVEYHITAGQPKIVENFFFEKSQLNEKVIGSRNMKIELADSSALRKILLNEEQKSLLKKGDLLDIDKLKAERERLEDIFKEQGYYNFDKDNIHF
ncbi:MAG: hypothetical protein KGV44_15390, partial [Flavobacteriaceae bacterium]|nr:hypothetical protein [Flavobacteriaceae bacterium]